MTNLLFLMSARSARLVACTALAVVVLSLAGCGNDKDVAPDLAFNFKCADSNPVSEPAIEKFLSSHDFTPFNEERVRKQYKLRLYPLAIDGTDDKRRILDFRGINENTSDEPVPEATIYSVGLYSPPPTRHDTPLENAMFGFVQTVLKCDVSNVTHGNNDAPRAAYFNTVYQAEQKRIASGRRCDRESGKPLDTHCPN
jgi:hypothetical protein